MTKSLIYPLLFALFALSACSGSEDFNIDTAQSSRELLMLRVSANNFTTVGGASSTRAIDNGMTTTFENGDRVGVIVLNGSTILADNIPYTYNSTTGSWAFDATNSEGKSAYYYDNELGSLTYIVYYPYSSQANGITFIDNLKAKFAPKANQRSKEAFRASDLMVWSVTQSPLKTLSAELKHAYACVSLLPKINVTLATGTKLSYVSTKVSDVSCMINGTLFLPYQLGDGSYRCILPADYSGEVRCFFTHLDKKTYDYTHSFSSAAVANTCHALTLEVNLGKYELAQTQAGDFYCNDVSDNGYIIIPGDAALTGDQKAACIGIVLKVGRDGDGNEWEDDCNYTFKGTTTTMSTINGYVLALYDAKDEKGYTTFTWGHDGIQVGTNMERYTGFYGYKNTNAIKEFAIQKNWDLRTNFPATYHATVSYETTYPAPAGSSGWFLPSAGQGQYWLNNRNVILASVREATSNSSYNWKSYYWSSSEGGGYPASRAWIVNFDVGDVLDSDKDYGYSNNVRGVFAF